MKRFIFLFLLLSLACFLPSTQAQVKTIKEKSLITDRTITYQVGYKNQRELDTPVRRNQIAIFRRDTKNLLLGNKCAEDIMRDYKFRYAVVPPNQRISGTRYFFHNAWANIRLFFKNGPFWKNRMHKKIKECRRLTGDIVD